MLLSKVSPLPVRNAGSPRGWVLRGAWSFSAQMHFRQLSLHLSALLFPA